MPVKRWGDGPQLTSQPFFHRWDTFQGKAYPNPIPGESERDQAKLDAERERRLRWREDWYERQERQERRHMEKRRREKKGRGY
jgi:hypothetical protein